LTIKNTMGCLQLKYGIQLQASNERNIYNTKETVSFEHYKNGFTITFNHII